MASIVVAGDTSGSITLAAPAIAGSNTLTLPTQTATLATLTTPSFASTIGVGGATAAASGAGITFPASQSGSSNANTLDDHEEGAWNLTVTPGGGSFNVANNQGYYVKIGRVVYINVWWRRTGETSLSGGIVLSGFPFPFASDATDIARQRLWLSGYAFAGLSSRSVMWIVPDGGGNATTGTAFALATDYVAGQTINASNFSGNNTELYINGFYMTN